MGHEALQLGFQLVFYALIAGFVLVVARKLWPELQRRMLRARLGSGGALGVGRVVEVSVLEEGGEGGQRMLLGVMPLVTARDHNGRARAPTLATYRVLIRYTPTGQEELVADAEHALTPAQLDALTVDRKVELRYDPAHPESVVVELASLQRDLQS